MPARHHPGVRLLFVAALLVGMLRSQDPDPYTTGKPAALQKLGYLGSGPFPLGDQHGSQDVDELLGQDRIHWLETAHFRIGCSLASRPLPDDPGDRRAIYQEARQLRQRFAGFPATPTRLDEWLQLHLLAQRVEGLYADFEQRAGIDAAWLDRNPGGAGAGPYLGCQEKFVVLVFQTEGDLARYLRRFTACREDRPWMQNFPRTGCFLFATSAESCQGVLQDPRVLHGHLAHGVCQNLLEAFCGLDRVPFWFAEGFAHWHARQIDPRIVDITNAPLEELHRFAEWDWPRKVKARQKHDLLPAQADLLTWYDGRSRTLVDHAVIWSQTDFLLGQEGPQVAAFLQSLRLQPLPSRYQSREAVLAWHEAALQRSFGWDLAGLDARWQKHVTRYPQ